MHRQWIFVLSTLLLVVLSQANEIHSGIVIEEVNREIDLTSQLAKHKVAINFKNTGSKPATSFHFVFPDEQAQQLSFFEVSDSEKNNLKVSKLSTSDKGTLYQVDLKKSVDGGASATLEAKLVFTHSMKPFPTHVAQGEKQYVVYKDNHYFYCPYQVKTQKSTVKLPNSNIESKSELKPSSSYGDSILYGPYSEVTPYKVSSMRLHFENTKPFLEITKMVKDIEISHWGSNVAVEETFDILHGGAVLKGNFDRYSYQRFPTSTNNHIPSIKQTLPASAKDVYYRDEIGNISSSHVSYRNERNGVLFEIEPRYPLFGGWKARFYTGYNLPISEHVSIASDGSYLLSIPFSTTTDDAIVDDITVRVILPEGASDIRVFAPVEIVGQSSDVLFTYLDTTGRPVSIIEAKNLISDHNKNLIVAYRLSSLGLLKEPILIVAAFFILCAFTMLYVRFDFTIGPKVSKSAYSERVEELLEQLREIFDRRSDLHFELDSALESSLESKNATKYNKDKKQTDATFQSLAKEVSKIINELEANDAGLAKRVTELEAKESERRASQTASHALQIAIKIDRDTSKASQASQQASNYSKLEAEVNGLLNDLIDSL